MTVENTIPKTAKQQGDLHANQTRFSRSFCPNKNILVVVMCAREGISGHELQHVNFHDDYMTTTNRQNSSLEKENWQFSKNP